MTDYNYYIYNLNVRSDKDIPFLKKKNFKNPDVTLIYDKNICVRSDNLFSLNENQGVFCKKNILSCKISDGFEIRYNNALGTGSLETFHNILNQPFAYALYQNKNLCVHASAIEINDSAFLFIGLSGGGKSYLLSELLKYGKFITEDISRITFQDEIPYIHPSHCLMKLDKLRHTNSEYFSLNTKLSYDNRSRSSYSVKSQYLSFEPVRIKACILLDFSNTFSIKQLNEEQSFATLMQSSFKSNPSFCSKGHDIAIDDQIANLISRTEFYIMKRKKDNSVVAKLVNFIENNL